MRQALALELALELELALALALALELELALEMACQHSKRSAGSLNASGAKLTRACVTRTVNPCLVSCGSGSA